MMATLTQETLIFYRQVRPWIVSGTMQNGVMKYQFSEDTPLSILDVFENIKDKLSYPCVAS